MRNWFEKKCQNLITLALLIKYMKTYRKAQIDPLYWEKKQRKEIKKFVGYIYNIPFYRDRFEQVGVLPEDIICGEDFLRLPTLTKEEYKKWMDDEYEKHPEEFKHWRKNFTSGSSGTPMRVLQRNIDVSSDTANFFRGVLIQNRKYRLFFDKTFNITSKEKKKKGGNSILQHIGIMNRLVFPGPTPVMELVEEFNKFEPDLIHGVQSAFLPMIEYAEENGIELYQPKLVCTLGEYLDDVSLQILESKWPGSIYNLYGTTESGNMGVSLCREPQVEGNRSHVIWHDTHVLNVVDDYGYPATRGRLLITTMSHKGFPLVNYDIGDLIEIDQGMNYPKRITNIIGRNNDVIHNTDGSYYTSQAISRIFLKTDGVIEFRAIQEDYDLIDFFIVIDPKYKQNEEMEMEKKEQIDENVRKLVGLEFYRGEKSVRIFFKDSLPKDTSGKRRMFLSKVAPKYNMNNKEVYIKQ